MLQPSPPQIKDNNKEEQFASERKEKLITESLYDIEQWVNELVILPPPSPIKTTITTDTHLQSRENSLLTPRTFLLDLSIEEALAIVHTFQKKVLHHLNKFTESDEKAMKQLKERIRIFMGEKFGVPNSRVFCRLSTRSPKDASLFEGSQCYQVTKELIMKEWIRKYYETRGKTILKEKQTYIYTSEMEDFEKYIRNEMKYCEEYLIFMKASQQSLSVSNEEEVMDILTNSERVLRDLIKALDFPSLYNMKLVFREWCPELSYEYEFRGFVHDFELMALTQYDNTFKFDDLIEKKDEIAHSILNYYNTIVKPLLISKSNDPSSAISKWNGRVIMDFAILQPSKEIIIVECNPFNEGTGGSLFEEDRAFIVENYSKTQQLDFRVVTDQLYNEILSHGTHVWESIFAEPREEILKEIKLGAQPPSSFCSII